MTVFQLVWHSAEIGIVLGTVALIGRVCSVRVYRHMAYLLGMKYAGMLLATIGIEANSECTVCETRILWSNVLNHGSYCWGRNARH